MNNIISLNPCKGNLSGLRPKQFNTASIQQASTQAKIKQLRNKFVNKSGMYHAKKVN